MLWNQQVKGLIVAQGVYKVLVNPHIPQKFKTVQDQAESKVSDEYEAWIMQDQAIFVRLLSTISESMLPHVICSKHAFEVWDKIQNYFNPHMKDRVRQLRVKLKLVKKGNNSIVEYVLSDKAIANL